MNKYDHVLIVFLIELLKDGFCCLSFFSSSLMCFLSTYVFISKAYLGAMVVNNMMLNLWPLSFFLCFFQGTRIGLLKALFSTTVGVRIQLTSCSIKNIPGKYVFLFITWEFHLFMSHEWLLFHCHQDDDDDIIKMLLLLGF